MRTLYLGLTGDDVKAWQTFLVGVNSYSDVVVSSTFDQQTLVETKTFQTSVGLVGAAVDGAVGSTTLAKAMALGYNPTSDDRQCEDGPNWPLPPTEGPLSLSLRAQTFGSFAYKPAGNPTNPEAIIITDNWAASNIINVSLPQLHGVVGAPANGQVPFHRLAAPQLQRLFDAWAAAGLNDLILTWAGSWAPRFIRGSRTVLSNHAWATAFDINVQWNMLGTQPVLKGQRGSVRELVALANQNGFYWGGHFHDRPDGMHFEVFKVLP